MPSWITRVAEADDHDAILAGMLAIQGETEGLKSAGFGRSMWEWQYLRHKHGSMIVVADDNGTICAYFHLLLLDMRYHGRPTIGAIIQDTATFASHRRQGIFSAMDAYALEQLRNRGIHFVYGFANDRSLPGYRNNPVYTIMTVLPVYLCPMDFGSVLAGYLRSGALGKAAGQILSPLYRMLRMRAPALAPDEEMVNLSQFDPEAESVARDFADQAQVGIDRTAEYLNWRFVEKPTHDYTIWGLRRNGHLYAYVVTRLMTLFSTQCVVFMDFGCKHDEQPALRRLIGARLAAERENGAGLGVTIGIHPFFHQLRTLGFVRLPERLVPRPLYFFSAPLAPDVNTDVGEATRWHITLADWDVM